MHRVIIVGQSLFADTLRELFAGSSRVEIVGLVAGIDELPSYIDEHAPDAILVADSHGEYLSAKTCLRIKSDLPIIYTTLNDDHFTVFTSRRVRAAQSQLLSAIVDLPKQS
jgi:DNA-binding NarL/FixJ family response regulator